MFEHGFVLEHPEGYTSQRSPDTYHGWSFLCHSALFHGPTPAFHSPDSMEEENNLPLIMLYTLHRVFKKCVTSVNSVVKGSIITLTVQVKKRRH